MGRNPTFKDIMEYPPENEMVFKDLVGLCKRGLIVPYIGAGLSIFETWNNYIKRRYEECFFMEINEHLDNICAAHKIRKKEGDKTFFENIRVSYGGAWENSKWKKTLKEVEGESISIVSELFSCPIITTNFDQLIEKLHNDKILVAFPHNYDELKNALNKRKRLLYKIHGCVSIPHKIVFDGSAYKEAYKQDSALVQSLSAYFQGFHFLFLGCGLNTNAKVETKEPYMELWESLLNCGTYHFAIQSCKKEHFAQKRDELEKRNIRPILFESGKYESVKIILNKMLYEIKTSSLKIPKYNTLYIERRNSVIEQITRRFKDNTFSVCALTGLGGVGKTRVLSEYAKNYELKYKDVTWFNAISKSNINSEIYQFVVVKKRLISENDERAKDPYEITFMFKRWLKEHH